MFKTYLISCLQVSLVPQFALHSDPVHWHLLRSLLGKVVLLIFGFLFLFTFFHVFIGASWDIRVYVTSRGHSYTFGKSNCHHSF